MLLHTKIELTLYQKRELKEIFSYHAAESKAGNPPGSIMAQVFTDGMVVSYVPYDAALAIAKITMKKKAGIISNSANERMTHVEDRALS